MFAGLLTFNAALSAEKRKAPNGARVIDLSKSPSSQFCEGIREEAKEKRYALKLGELKKLKGEVEARISILEEKRTEYQKWRQLREQFMAKAEKSLVEIYGQMRPDAAAGRLEKIDKQLAAAILLKLSSRKAGVILNEMSVDKAAELTRVIAASGELG